MAIVSIKQRLPTSDAPSGPPRTRRIATRAGWSLTEYLCTAGPHDRSFEERHHEVSMALVTHGTFHYRTSTGGGILYPGAFLLGNPDTCYECGHEHSHGDRCLALSVTHDLFAEIASGASSADRCRFRRAILPAVSDLAPISVSLRRATESATPLALEELVFTTIETVVRAVGTNHSSPRRARPMTMKKMSTVFDYIDAHLRDGLDLGNLSALVALSKYHFLRSFKQECGMTPHQYILGRRLRAAAFALRTTDAAVARIAFDQGFGDLSTFNHTFRRVMGVTPKAYRSNP
ncbi:MAG TPA: AraC family transcriptional regulator [Steroidobacteraceae bacterium]|nr:AraC family transcriptional regulator [Steroidobacteraceae bacterium]